MRTFIRSYAEISELLSLLSEKKAFNSKKFPNLSQAVRYFKEDEKGVSEVCTLVEDFANDRVKDCERKFALYLIKDGKSDAEIVSVTHLTAGEVEELRNN